MLQLVLCHLHHHPAPQIMPRHQKWKEFAGEPLLKKATRYTKSRDWCGSGTPPHREWAVQTSSKILFGVPGGPSFLGSRKSEPLTVICNIGWGLSSALELCTIIVLYSLIKPLEIEIKVKPKTRVIMSFMKTVIQYHDPSAIWNVFFSISTKRSQFPHSHFSSCVISIILPSYQQVNAYWSRYAWGTKASNKQEKVRY